VRLLRPFVMGWADFEPVTLGPYPPSPRRVISALSLPAARGGLSAARSLAKRTFETERARALLAGHAAHSMLPLEVRPSGGIGLLLLATAHAYGWGFPRGGSQRLAVALAATLSGRSSCSRSPRSSTTPGRLRASTPPGRTVTCRTVRLRT